MSSGIPVFSGFIFFFFLFLRLVDCEKKRREEKMGRKKVDVSYIEDDSTRHITFVKRYEGMAKKGHDLCKLTGCKVFMFVESERGEFIKIFSNTGDFGADMLWMGNQMGVADANPDSVFREIYTMNDYEQTTGKDKDGNQFIEWKRKDKTSYVRDPMLRRRGVKYNSRAAKLYLRAREQGAYNEDGTLQLTGTSPEDEKKKRVRKRRRYNGPPIIEDDDEIREAVGEERISKKNKKTQEVPHQVVQTPMVSVTESNSAVDSISVGIDGTVNLSRTEVTSTHKNVRMSCQNLAELSQKFGFASGTPVFRFSHALSSSNPSGPSVSAPAEPPPPPEPVIYPPQYSNLIPGVQGDIVMALLNAPRPPTLYDRRIAERERRNSETPHHNPAQSWEDLLNSDIDLSAYGSFMNP